MEKDKFVKYDDDDAVVGYGGVVGDRHNNAHNFFGRILRCDRWHLCSSEVGCSGHASIEQKGPCLGLAYYFWPFWGYVLACQELVHLGNDAVEVSEIMSLGHEMR